MLNGPTIGRLKLKPSEGTRVDGEERDYRSWQCTVIRKENILILDIPMHNLPIVHDLMRLKRRMAQKTVLLVSFLNLSSGKRSLGRSVRRSWNTNSLVNIEKRRGAIANNNQKSG